MNEKQLMVFEAEDLNPMEKLMLMGMIEFPELSQTAVAKRVHMNVPHASTVAKSIEAKGYIKRHKREKWAMADIEIMI